jgi:hypothetical protein
MLPAASWQVMSKTEPMWPTALRNSALCQFNGLKKALLQLLASQSFDNRTEAEKILNYAYKEIP